VTEPVSREETEEFLRLAGEEARETLVLVGGQAVAFWVLQYEHRVRIDKDPLVSGDVDFCATRKVMRACAANVRAELKEAALDDVTPNIGLLLWSHANKKIRVDFLGAPFGQDYDDLLKTSIPIDVPARGLKFRVMHPERCFESRVCNLALDGYRTPHALAQLQASIVCCREFTRDTLHRDGWQDASAIIERAFKFCRDNREARAAKSKYGIDPFDAVVHTDPKLPDAFVTKRYPQMAANIAARRTT